MLATTAREQTPLTKQLNTLTLWIAAAAGVTMVVMFILGAQRGDRRRSCSRARWRWRSPPFPEAMPTVLQVVMSLGASDLARRGAVLKDLASVETLGSTSAINSDKTGTLTMNQMTAVEVLDPTDRYTISGPATSSRGRSITRPDRATRSRRDPALRHRQRRPARRRQGRRRPDRGRAARARPQGGARHRGDPRPHPRLATLPFDPTYKLMATFTRASDDGSCAASSRARRPR